MCRSGIHRGDAGHPSRRRRAARYQKPRHVIFHQPWFISLVIGPQGAGTLQGRIQAVKQELSYSLHVSREDESAKTASIEGVPCFILGGIFAVSRTAA